jgi:hypothetical protein
VSETTDPKPADAPTASAGTVPAKTRSWGVRERLALALGLLVGSFAGRAFVGDPAGNGASGLAQFLGAAVGGTVAEEDFVWERSRGFLADALWGRDVLFSAKLSGNDGAQYDVFRATVRTSREGRALAAHSVTNVTRTPLADERVLLVSGDNVAFAARSAGRVTGATVLDLASECQGCSPWQRRLARLARRFAPEEDASVRRHVLALGKPAANAELQWFDGALELRSAAGVVRFEPRSSTVRCSNDGALQPKAWTVPAAQPRFSREKAPPSVRPAPVVGRTLFEGAPPALTKSTTKTPGGVPLELVHIDTRQVELRLHAGQKRPHATTGPGGSGAVLEHELKRLVARLEAHPFAGHGNGFIEERRTLVPPGERPTLALDDSGALWFGTSTSRLATLDVRSLVQSVPPSDAREHLAMLCRTENGQLLYALAGAKTTVADVAAGLGETCAGSLSLEVSDRPLETDEARLADAAPSDEPFFTLLHREPGPTLAGSLRLVNADGPAPPPSWLPAVQRAKRERKDGLVEFFSIDVTRFDWRVLPGRADGAGHTCDDALEPADQQRLVLGFGFGSSDPENRRGLAIDGAAVEPFRVDHGVLFTPPRPPAQDPRAALTLALSVDDLTTSGDALELVLLAEAATLRSEARELGAPKPRGALCMPSPRQLLYAEGRFDSPEPVAEELLAAGCRRIVSTDRGRQNAALFYRAGVNGTAALEANEVALVGLAREAPGRTNLMPE